MPEIVPEKGLLAESFPANTLLDRLLETGEHVVAVAAPRQPESRREGPEQPVERQRDRRSNAADGRVVARPGPVGRFVAEAGANRIEDHVAADREQVRLALDQ